MTQETMLLIGGALVVAAIMVDFLLTTVSIRRAGPATKTLGRALAALLGVFPDGGLISRYQGPVILSTVAAFWIAGLWAGWWMVFLSGTDHMTGPNDSPVGVADTVGFAGSAISTMGLGVITPQAPRWHIAAVLASISGMVVLTLSMTFVLNVTQIATQSRALRRQFDRAREGMERLAPSERAELALSSDAVTVDGAERLTQSRQCFPLVIHYDRRGGRDDIGRAAKDLLDTLPAASAASNRVGSERLILLRRAIEGLVPEE